MNPLPPDPNIRASLDEIFVPIQEEYNGGEPMLPGTISEAKDQILALFKTLAEEANRDNIFKRQPHPTRSNPLKKC